MIPKVEPRYGRSEVFTLYFEFDLFMFCIVNEWMAESRKFLS